MFTAGTDVLGCIKNDRLWFLLNGRNQSFSICLSTHQWVHDVNIWGDLLLVPGTKGVQSWVIGIP